VLASFSRQKFLVSKNILPLDQQEQSKAAFSHPNYYNNNLIFQGRKFQVFKWVGFVFLLFFKSFFFFFFSLSESSLLFFYFIVSCPFGSFWSTEGLGNMSDGQGRMNFGVVNIHHSLPEREPRVHWPLPSLTHHPLDRKKI
jgi:hypothetical protein